jgi:hypothetical protein
LKTRTLTAVLAALALAACDEPPTREIDAARSALDRARQGGADRYVPERFREAAEALDAAQDKVDAQDYRGALSAATDADEKSRAALKAAEAARVVARAAAETALVEAEALLEEIQTLRDQAAGAGVPAAAFAALDPATDAARQTSAAVVEAIHRGDFAAAQRGATDLKRGVATIADRFRAAVDAWKDSHRPRPAKGRRAR